MSTNAVIIKKNEDGSFDGNACQYYGFLSFTGLLLSRYYRDPERVDKLMKLGELQQLGAHLSVAPAVAKYGVNYRQNPQYRKLYTSDPDEWYHLMDEAFGTTIYLHPEDTYTQPFQHSENTYHWNDLRSLANNVPTLPTYLYVYRDGDWYALHTGDFGLTPNLKLKDALKKPEYE